MKATLRNNGKYGITKKVEVHIQAEDIFQTVVQMDAVTMRASKSEILRRVVNNVISEKGLYIEDADIELLMRSCEYCKKNSKIFQ